MNTRLYTYPQVVLASLICMSPIVAKIEGPSRFKQDSALLIPDEINGPNRTAPIKWRFDWTHHSQINYSSSLTNEDLMNDVDLFDETTSIPLDTQTMVVNINRIYDIQPNFDDDFWSDD